MEQSVAGRWDYSDLKEPRRFGPETTYKLAMDFLADCREVEDWGCGCGYSRQFCRTNYIGVDGSPSTWTDRVADLESYVSQPEGILLRHVLGHNFNWEKILGNALQSFTKKLVVVCFLELKDRDVIVESPNPDANVKGSVPSIHLSRPKMNELLKGTKWYSVEVPSKHPEEIFYITKPKITSMHEPLGQILPDSAFGKALTNITKRSETIVEIGTWRGGGSTRCIANGLIRGSQRFITIEQDPARHAEASARYHDPRITFLLGGSNQFYDSLPLRIDLLLLDGDDQTTDRDFDVLVPRAKAVALDDTNERKNKRGRKYFLADHVRWSVSDHSEDRNGWLIATRAK